MVDKPQKSPDKVPDVVPLWVTENPVLSNIPLIGPAIAKTESGLTGMSMNASGAVIEEYAHRPDGLRKIETSSDGLVRSSYDPFVNPDGVLRTKEQLSKYGGYQIIEYNPDRSKNGLRCYEARFGRNGVTNWNTESFDPERRDDGLINRTVQGKRLTERYDPDKARTKGLIEHIYDHGISESWKYQRGSQPDGLVQETQYKVPYGYEKQFAERPDGLVSEQWEEDPEDDTDSITTRTYNNGRIKKLHKWELYN